MSENQTLEELLEALEEWLREVDEFLKNTPVPVPTPPREEVEERLDDVEGTIDQILDPNTPPSLDPPNAGSVDTSVTATTPTQYGQVTYQLAREAVLEERSINPSASVIGSRIKTIKHLLFGFRASLD